jgi:hypothetical protein
MPNIPKYCKECDRTYWSNFEYPSHRCINIKEAHLEFKHFKKKETRPFKPKKPFLDYICKTCQAQFKSRRKGRVYCSPECRKKDELKMHIQTCNDKWMNPPPRKKPKYSLSQLNRMAEWKRVWGDESWLKRFNAIRG